MSCNVRSDMLDFKSYQCVVLLSSDLGFLIFLSAKRGVIPLPQGVCTKIKMLCIIWFVEASAW
jgi:hypothetical protein